MWQELLLSILKLNLLTLTLAFKRLVQWVALEKISQKNAAVFVGIDCGHQNELIKKIVSNVLGRILLLIVRMRDISLLCRIYLIRRFVLYYCWVFLLRVVPYFDEPVRRVKIQTTSKNTYILLTNREVKMARYWPSSLFAFLWISTSSRSIKTQKENEANTQPSWPN